MQATDQPLVACHAFGKGHAAYVAFAIGRYLDIHDDAHIARRMTELIDRLLPTRQLVTNAPRTVETTLWQQRQLKRTIVHLANRSVTWTLPTDERQITDILPVHGVEVTMPAPCPEPTVSCRGADVTARVEDGRLTMRIPVLHAYAALVIEDGDGTP